MSDTVTAIRHADDGGFATLELPLRPSSRRCTVSAGHRASGQTKAAITAKPAAASCQRATFRVVVDVGHTVAVPGAMSARGVPEYAFNLAARPGHQTGAGRCRLRQHGSADHRRGAAGRPDSARDQSQQHAGGSLPRRSTMIPFRTICCRPGNTKDRISITTTTIPATRCSSPTTIRDRAGSLLFGELPGQGIASARLALHAALHAAADGTPPP